MQLKMLEKEHTTLKKLIIMAEAEIDEEDVAWVEKKVAQLDDLTPFNDYLPHILLKLPSGQHHQVRTLHTAYTKIHTYP